MEQVSIRQKVRSPTLQTVIMVEMFIKDHSGDYKKTQVFNNLPRKVMWSVFQVIMKYLAENNKIVYDKDGYVVYIWNPELVAKYRNRKDLRC